MEPETLKQIDDLKPDPKNPRVMDRHEADALKNSLQKFGDLGAIVFNVRTQQLVGGHQRIEIMKRLGAEKRVLITQRFDPPDETGTTAIGHVWIGAKSFAYREVDWDEATQRTANIAANRISGQFDMDLLAQVNYELSQIENGQDFLNLTGQTELEVKKLLEVVGGNGDTPTNRDIDPENLLSEGAHACPRCGFEFEIAAKADATEPAADAPQPTES